MRTEFWGYAADEALDAEALIEEKYRGIRPAPGYPACPEHSEKATLFDMLDAPGNAGMSITDHFAMLPAASVSGWYFSHPRSQYFVVGRVSGEQVEDYARRKGVSLAQAERWLAANLDYDPGDRRPAAQRLQVAREIRKQAQVAVAAQVVAVEEQRLAAFDRMASRARAQQRERIPDRHAAIPRPAPASCNTGAR